MQFFIVVLLISFVFFLFSLYSLIKDDVSFIRAGVGPERVFNITFIVALAALFFARLFYIIFYQKIWLLNPFLFIVFPYFPGLSLTGGVLGGALSLAFLSGLKKIPFNRIFDIFSVSFLFSMPVGLLGFFLLSGKKLLSLEFGVTLAVYIFLLIFFIRFLTVFSERGRIKPGGMGYIFIMLFSIWSIAHNILFSNKILHLENLILGISFIVSLIIFFGPQAIHSSTRLRRK